MTHLATVTDPDPIIGRGALWRRDFGLLWGSSAVSMLGSTGVNVAGPLLAFSMNGSPVDVGRVAAAGTLPGLLLLLPAGVIADRLNRRSIMIVSQVLRGAVAAVLAVSVFVGAYSLSLLTLAVAAGGICLAFYSVAEISAVPQIVPGKGRLTKAVATNEARSHAALLLGRSLGCVLYGLLRWLPFAADATGCLVSIGALVCMRPEPFRDQAGLRRRGVRTLAVELGEGLGELWMNGLLRTALAVCTITNLCFQAVIVVLVVLAKRHGLSAGLIGALLGASGLGGVIGALYVPNNLREKCLMSIAIRCAWVWTALIGLIAVFPNPVVWLVAWSGVGFMGARMNIALNVHQVREVSPGMLGRVASANRFLSLGAIPLGTFCGGYVIAQMGAQRTAFAVAVLIGVIAGAVTYLNWRGRTRSHLGAQRG